jgi:hypothetical protein
MSIVSSVRAVREASARLALCAGVCLAIAAPARAQMINPAGSDSSRRPYRTLFGGAAEGPRGNDSLILNAAAFGGYDDDIFARGSGSSPGSAGRPTVSGTFVGSQASLGYQRRFTNASVMASAATANRYVTDSQEFVTTFASGSVGVQGSANSRTSYQLHQTVGYRPFFTPVPFPPTSPVGPSLGGELTPPLPDGVGVETPDDFTVASDRDGIRYSTYGEVQRRLTQRSSLQFRGQYTVADFASQDLDAVDNRRWLGGATYAYDMTRYLSARLGYTYRSFNTNADGVAGNHDLNVGLLYNRPFTIGSGRTVLSFTTGSTILKKERLAGNEGGGQFTIRAIGSANLAHAFSAAWQGNINYSHSVGYMDGFTEPIEGDRVVASLGGLLGPALDVSMSAGYVTGAIGLQERNFDSAIASARLRLALHANVALFAQYFYYQYAYADGVADQVLPASELRRQGFRAGLNIWLPVLR